MAVQCYLMSASLHGVDAIPVTVEVSVGPGLPGIAIVGMADTAVQEARERVRAAIKASGFAMPTEKIVVNLAPGDVRKSGSGFDLPIALGILAASGQIGLECLEGRLFVGELSLDGTVRDVAGSLAYCICASKMGYGFVSASRRRVPLKGSEQLELAALSRLRTEDGIISLGPDVGSTGVAGSPSVGLDFTDVSGHEAAKRALQIAAAGRHCLLMVGPPGSGKTMLASRVPSILPPLSEDERLEAAAVHSVAGEAIDSLIAGIRPFRHPHHSSTIAGLLGGGNPVRPGEVSLAHRGVLFLDELAEFKPSVLQSLRQPIEQGCVLVTRASEKLRLPADFMLIAATNPCPCGYFSDASHECQCPSGAVRRYQSRIGGPLIDRFSMQLDIHRVSSSKMLEKGRGTSSSALREDVMKAREFGAWRRTRRDPQEARCIPLPTQGADAVEACGLSDDAKDFALAMAESGNLSGRALVGSLGVARTIADMEESEAVLPDHLAEAFGLRMSDGIGGF